MWFPILLFSALDKIGMDIKKKQSADLFIYFLPIMVYACYLNLQLQANVTGPFSTCAGFTSCIYRLFAFNIKISWFGGPAKKEINWSC